MSFRNPLLTLLQIFRSDGGRALIARSGASSDGNGQAVIQLYTGAAGESFPGEIFAYVGGVSGDLLALSSPALNTTDPTVHRSQLELYSGGTSGTGPTTAIIQGDEIDLTSSDDLNGCLLIIQSRQTQLGGPVYGANGQNPLDVALGLNVHGGPLNVAGDPYAQTGSVSVPAVAANGGYASVTVTFPKAFTKAPHVVASAPSGRLTAAVESVTASSCVIGFNNWTAANSSAGTGHWIASNA